MNIIKINNIKSVLSMAHSLEIKSNERFDNKITTMVILDEQDIQNENRVMKLRGYLISILLLPSKYKYTFNETPMGKKIQPNLIENVEISYY